MSDSSGSGSGGGLPAAARPNAAPARMTGGEALARTLAAARVGPMFGMGGFQLLPFYEAVRALGLTHVLINDERTGCFAADAWARITNRPGVCDATLGPGATNLTTALVEALNAGTPMLAIAAPMGETMIAAALLGAAGIAPPAGPTALAVNGAPPVPWGRHARHLVHLEGEAVTLAAAVAPSWRHGGNIGREPRDELLSPPTAPHAEGRLPASFGTEAGLLATALLRACQIAGALGAALDLTVEYANTRKQFGRPIGRFQAVQQNLAVLAGEVAAAQVAAANACRAADRHGLGGAGFEIGCAKVVAGEAATTGAAIAHQVFAAIGFTEEHALHHLTRRLWSWREEAGTERFWAARLGREVQALNGDGAALWPFITARDEDDDATP